MFIEALFTLATRAKTQKKLKCLSTYKWIKKMWTGAYLESMSCFSENVNVMCGKEVISREKKSETRPSATLLIENSTISNLQKLQRAGLLSGEICLGYLRGKKKIF